MLPCGELPVTPAELQHFGRPAPEQEIAPGNTSLQVVDPRDCSDWDSAISVHPSATFFHKCAWAEVLMTTYGHRPFYARRRHVGGIEVLATMEVSSPWTGRRGVSLPFTDFCEPLADCGQQLAELHEIVLGHGRQRGWRYLECRHGPELWPGSTPSVGFLGHVVDLAGGADKVQREFDGAIGRGVRRAEAAGVKIEFSMRAEAMDAFYRLHCRTRQRHGVPPQPARFFRNIQRLVIEAGHGFLALARLAGRPIAAAVFFHHGHNAVFKFGASDYAFQSARANNLIMRTAILRLIEQGFTRLHMGRTSLSNEGLRRFKLGFGAREEKLEYCRYDFRKERFVPAIDRAESWANAVFRRLPVPALRLAGAVLYPHLS
jgi:hypothetical protein